MKPPICILILALCLPLAAQLPVSNYDFMLPEHNVSPISTAMGGLNVANPGDFYAAWSNPALIGGNDNTALLASFRLKNSDGLSFLEAAQISNALRAKQFKYFTLLAKQTAWSYQPVVRVHISEASPQFRYFDYQLDKAQVTLAATDESWRPVGFGLNLKYLTGRLVYYGDAKPSLIDEKARGFSFDLGGTLQSGDVTFGLAAYDVFSQLYWDNYDSVHLTRRMAFGAQYGSDALKLSAGLQGKLAKSTDTTYHFGFEHLWDYGGSGEGALPQALALRLGLYSHDFYGAGNINYTFGAGYNYNIVRFDFSLNSKGMQLQDSEYLFSLGVGLP